MSRALSALHAAYHAQRWAELETLCQAELQQHGPDPVVLHFLALAASETGVLDQALQRIEQALSLGAKKDALHNTHGNILLALGQSEAAARAYGLAVKLNPKNVAAHTNLAKIQVDQLGQERARGGRLEPNTLREARLHLKQALQVDGRNANAWNIQGLLQMYTGAYAEAEQAFANAHRYAPHWPEAQSNLALALLRQGQVDAAVQLLEQGLAQNPNYLSYYINLGEIYLEQRRYDLAQQRLERGLQLAPQHPSQQLALQHNLANTLREKGDLPTALSLYQSLLAHTPADAMLLMDVSRACFMTGAMEAASQYAIQAVEQAQGLDAKADLWLAELLLRLEQWPGLADICAQLQQLPTLHPAAQTRLQVLAALGLYQARDWAGCRAALNQAQAAFKQMPSTEDRLTLEMLIYQRYLHLLLPQMPALQAPRDLDQADLEPVLHCLGDSHCLALNGQSISVEGVLMRIQSHLLLGCKAFHLAKPEPNVYQKQFEYLLQQCAPGTWVMLTVGEIDCRLTEGIMEQWRKHPNLAVEDIVLRLLNNLGRYLQTQLARTGVRLILQNVMAPNVDRSAWSDEDCARLVRVIQCYNAGLQLLAQQLGAQVLDVYQLSAGAEGWGSGLWHLDHHHLKPQYLQALLGSGSPNRV